MDNPSEVLSGTSVCDMMGASTLCVTSGMKLLLCGVCRRDTWLITSWPNYIVKERKQFKHTVVFRVPIVNLCTILRVYHKNTNTCQNAHRHCHFDDVFMIIFLNIAHNIMCHRPGLCENRSAFNLSCDQLRCNNHNIGKVGDWWPKLVTDRHSTYTSAY